MDLPLDQLWVVNAPGMTAVKASDGVLATVALSLAYSIYLVVNSQPYPEGFNPVSEEMRRAQDTAIRDLGTLPISSEYRMHPFGAGGVGHRHHLSMIYQMAVALKGNKRGFAEAMDMLLGVEDVTFGLLTARDNPVIHDNWVQLLTTYDPARADLYRDQNLDPEWVQAHQAELRQLPVLYRTQTVSRLTPKFSLRPERLLFQLMYLQRQLDLVEAGVLGTQEVRDVMDEQQIPQFLRAVEDGWEWTDARIQSPHQLQRTVLLQMGLTPSILVTTVSNLTLRQPSKEIRKSKNSAQLVADNAHVAGFFRLSNQMALWLMSRYTEEHRDDAAIKANFAPVLDSIARSKLVDILRSKIGLLDIAARYSDLENVLLATSYWSGRQTPPAIAAGTHQMKQVLGQLLQILAAAVPVKAAASLGGEGGGAGASGSSSPSTHSAASSRSSSGREPGSSSSLSYHGSGEEAGAARLRKETLPPRKVISSLPPDMQHQVFSYLLPAGKRVRLDRLPYSGRHGATPTLTGLLKKMEDAKIIPKYLGRRRKADIIRALESAGVTVLKTDDGRYQVPLLKALEERGKYKRTKKGLLRRKRRVTHRAKRHDDPLEAFLEYLASQGIVLRATEGEELSKQEKANLTRDLLQLVGLRAAGGTFLLPKESKQGFTTRTGNRYDTKDWDEAIRIYQLSLQAAQQPGEAAASGSDSDFDLSF